MVNTAVVSSASPNHLSFLVTGDASANLTIANSTILAAMPPGPLRDAWNLTYLNAAAKRLALAGGGPVSLAVAGGIPGGSGTGFCELESQLVVAVNFATAAVNQFAADVVDDGVTATKAAILILMNATNAGQIAYLHLRHRFSSQR